MTSRPSTTEHPPVLADAIEQRRRRLLRRAGTRRSRNRLRRSAGCSAGGVCSADGASARRLVRRRLPAAARLDRRFGRRSAASRRGPARHLRGCRSGVAPAVVGGARRRLGDLRLRRRRRGVGAAGVSAGVTSRRRFASSCAACDGCAPLHSAVWRATSAVASDVEIASMSASSGMRSTLPARRRLMLPLNACRVRAEQRDHRAIDVATRSAGFTRLAIRHSVSLRSTLYSPPIGARLPTTGDRLLASAREARASAAESAATALGRLRLLGDWRSMRPPSVAPDCGVVTGAWRFGLRRHEHRRVEQYRVLAQQTAARPARFDQQRHERLGDRAVRSDLDGGAAVAACADRELEVRQEHRPVDAVALEHVVAGQADLQARQLLGSRRNQLDLGIERLVQGGVRDGFHPDPARTASQGTAVRPSAAGAASVFSSALPVRVPKHPKLLPE